jgi:hypothetical protein
LSRREGINLTGMIAPSLAAKWNNDSSRCKISNRIR